MARGRELGTHNRSASAYGNETPITVDITGTPGTLLGNIICDLANLLNVRRPNLRAIESTLKDIANAILALI
jgi:hypothetical protein